MVNNCIFCTFSADEEIVFQSETFVFLKNKYPIVPYHLLLVVRRHVREERLFNESEINGFFTGSNRAYDYMKKLTDNKPLTFVNPPQMQSVQHYHRHYVDGVFGIHGVADALKHFYQQMGKVT